MGSEPGHGWGYLLIAIQIAKKHNQKVLFLTLERYIEACRAELIKLDLIQYVEFKAIKIPRILDKPTNGLLLRIGYLFWCKNTKKKISNVDENLVNVIHHANYASEILPHPIPKNGFKDARKVIGPLGSTQNLKLSRILIKDLLDVVIFSMDNLKYFLTPFLFRLFNNSNMTVVYNSQSLLDKLNHLRKSIQLEENSNAIVRPSLIINESVFDHVDKTKSKTLKFAIISVFNRRKRIDFALEVLANLKNSDFICDIYGDGPLEKTLRTKVEALGLNAKINWKGTTSRFELRKKMPMYNAILHPSVREGASTITGEAIIAGVPIVVFDHTGASETLKYLGINDSIVQTSNLNSKRDLIEAFSQTVLHVSSRKLSIENPFSFVEAEREVESWYELSKNFGSK